MKVMTLGVSCERYRKDIGGIISEHIPRPAIEDMGDIRVNRGQILRGSLQKFTALYARGWFDILHDFSCAKHTFHPWIYQQIPILLALNFTLAGWWYGIISCKRVLGLEENTWVESMWITWTITRNNSLRLVIPHVRGGLTPKSGPPFEPVSQPICRK